LSWSGSSSRPDNEICLQSCVVREEQDKAMQPLWGKGRCCWVWVLMYIVQWLARGTPTPLARVQSPALAFSGVLRMYYMFVPRLLRGTLNRGAVCIRTHLRSCADLKEPGWPSEGAGVQRHTDIQYAKESRRQKYWVWKALS